MTTSALQAAPQSSRVSQSPASPCKHKNLRMPSLPPASLIFVPNPSGVGGVLVPKPGRANGKSPSQSATFNEFDSCSDEAGLLESDSNASSPNCLLPSPSFSTDRHKLSSLSAVPFQPECAFIKAEPFAQASAPYSSVKPAPGLATPNLSHSDSNLSETFLLNNASISGHADIAGCRFGCPPWHPKSVLSQLHISSPPNQFQSPVSTQSHQRQVFPPAPPQLASLLQSQFPVQHQSTIKLPPPGALPSPLCSGNSSYSSTSSGVPSLALGHPVVSEPSLGNFLTQTPQACQQPVGHSEPNFDFDFDLLSQSTPSVGSNLSMTSSMSSASLHESSMTDQMNLPLLGSFQGVSPLPKASRNSLRRSESSLQGQAALHSPFTFVPAECSAPTQYYQQPASSHCHDLQSQVLTLS